MIKIFKAVAIMVMVFAAGFLSAQQNGWSFEGSLTTGLRVDFGSGGYDWRTAPDYEYIEDPARPGEWILKDKIVYKGWQPVFGLWNDDEDEDIPGNRIRLKAGYNNDYNGFLFDGTMGFQNLWYWDPTFIFWKLNSMAGWFDLAGGLVKISIGIVGSNEWVAPADKYLHYSTGIGSRIELIPVDGLNIGFFLGPTKYDAFWPLKPDLTWSGNSEITLINDMYRFGGDTRSTFFDALMESSFGIKYEHNMFDIAAGFKMSGRATGPALWEISYPDYTFSTVGLKYGDENALEDLERTGHRVYLSAALKAVNNLWFAFSVEGVNLAAFNDYGWLTIQENFEYNISRVFTVGIKGIQTMFGKDTIWNLLDDGLLAKGEEKPVWMEFTPRLKYNLTEKTTLGIEVPVSFWQGIIDYNVAVRPQFSYRFGDGFVIDCYYQLNILSFSKDTGLFYDISFEDPSNIEIPRASDPFVRSTIQVNMKWTF